MAADIAALTDDQRRLVEANLGLVALHLKRHVARISKTRLEREWDDLFQEGCLGLMEAARLFDADRGITFAAFALPRIHNFVSKAMNRDRSSIYVPRQRKHNTESQSDDKSESQSETGFDPLRVPQVVSLSDVSVSKIADRRWAPLPNDSIETVEQRLGREFERAVGIAREKLSAKVTRRGDRDELIELITNERLLITQPELRRPLRQIARETNSSYSRVAECDKLLNNEVRHQLATDPEFNELRRRKRADPRGGALPIDSDTERSLARVSAEEFASRFQRANPSDRADMLHRVLKLAQKDMGKLLKSQFSRLTRKTRRQLLTDTSDLREKD